MTPDENAEQIAFWNGPAGDRWVREQDEIDRAFASFTGKLFAAAALRAGERVLDIGCGCGTSTLAVAGAVGASGFVTGVDVSVPMLERARRVTAHLPNVELVCADASLRRFERAPFDAAISRYGVMFFRDPIAAFSNLRAALRPSARLTFICWRTAADNDWIRIPYEIARQHLPSVPVPGPDEPGPLSFGDRARIERILSSAGFSSISIAPFDSPLAISESGLEGALDFSMTNGLTGRLLREASSEIKARVRAALAPALLPHVEKSAGKLVTLGGGIWIVNASA